MKIIFTLTMGFLVLLILLFFSVKIAVKEKNEKRKYKAEIERKDKCIAFMYRHAQELAEIRTENANRMQEIENAKTDEEIAAIVSAVVADNNRLCNEQKSGNNIATGTAETGTAGA